MDLCAKDREIRILATPDRKLPKYGLTKDASFSIEIEDESKTKPEYQRPRHHNPSDRDTIIEHTRKMVKHGIAEPSCGGEWCANVVLTPKKDGTKRFAIDFRGLNKKTRRTVYTYQEST